MLKFLVDECLSPELVQKAIEHGYYESTCVRNRGWAGAKDYDLIQRVVAEDFAFVTCNSVDFRGNGPGNLGGEHAKQELHAGLVCLNSDLALDLDLQLELFQIALDIIQSDDLDLVNKALEIFHGADGNVVYDLYDIPVEVQTHVSAAAPAAGSAAPAEVSK